MLKIHSEIRMIWLMVLIISAVGAWFLDTPILTYLCIIALVVSVIQYVDAIQKPTQAVVENAQLKLQHPVQYTSKIPLYIASLVAVVGGVMHWSWLVGLGATAWIFFFLRWLRRLENNLNDLHLRLSAIQQHSESQPVAHVSSSEAVSQPSALDHSSTPTELGFIDQIKHWLFQGNPVLKVAIVVLVIGVILLLRFATEHWQLSLALKLSIVAVVSMVITPLGYLSLGKNRSFALALEGLGLAGLFLTLFFAYYNHVIASLLTAAMLYGVIMLITVLLSLRQQAIELALMAMMVAYLAPFTLPVREATAVELIAYYLGVNVAVAILSTLRPWKILNQIAFLATVIIGGAYAFVHGHVQDRQQMTLLVLAHSAIFIWLSFRFSQLLAKADVAQFKLKPALDIGLIFGAPIVAFGFIYLMYFEDTLWQAGISFLFAVLYAALYQLAKANQSISLISQSYLSLSLIFLALIPPILLKEQWSVMGWAIEGALIYLFALQRASNISRYLAMGLLVMAGLSGLYYWVDLGQLPQLMFSVLSLSYLTVVVGSNIKPMYQQQLSLGSIIFLSLLSLSASSMLLLLGLDYFSGALQYVYSLFIVTLMYAVLNEVLMRTQATGSWLVPKWFGMIPMMLFALGLVVYRTQQGVIEWFSFTERVGFALSALLLAVLWLRPMLGVRAEKEGVAFGTLASLALSSVCIVPSMPFISAVILPLAFGGFSYLQKQNLDWQRFWQARSSLLLMLLWIVCSQLFSQQAFQGYLIPVLNPFDMVSLAILACFLWMLSLQVKTGLDRGMGAMLMVLSLLWLSSYIVLRGLHVYLHTPYNAVAIWDNATIQLSLTLLWVSLAFITMSIATRQQLRSLWILGGSILLIVTLKLVLLDLSHVGTLTRVISFLGAGLVMLIIAYIAPMPESDKSIAMDAS
ncbi:DUF2339 domain-containing protein [Acinetobacter sp. 187]|uniref:DUF2339 domain-containing protein n=1 Tax=Acinetobacter lanii TaxID=2715163 RepID=UPI00140AFECA|nr:DUF2339 domain-containing protein [Acinetobacter lanii]NHC03574.1 DUF2339 domain-containing protein [Acinetobacter lanii]